ncbi:MAG: MBOAT family O-acyltransferase [Flavobacteriales bacterium]|nr:MBOAT family O-acyltransferase [Flavobacteriales bacterium]
MLFNSIEFIYFLVVIFTFYWSLSNSVKYQNITLLLGSYFFYGWWDYRFLNLIFVSTVINYFLGLQISKYKSKRNFFLWFSMIFNLGLLSYFKYFNFFLTSFLDVINSFKYFDLSFHPWEIILPIGISFYTFQAMSYSIDVFYNRIKPTNDFFSFSVFISFFPQLIAGPIEKSEKLIPQFQTKRKFLFKDGKIGIYYITYGLFKKVVVADNISLIVDEFYSNVNFYSINSSFTLITIFLYSIQIYCDFSGYSNIAIGVARLFGIKLSTNFRTPYFSKNIIEFWRRWHITLSFWFRDYLFIPLGGSRITKFITFRNLFLVFTLSGLWHGANSKFVVWGLLHFCFYILYIEVFRRLNIYKSKILSSILTFIIVSLFWIPFRAINLNDSLLIIKSLINFNFTTLPIGLIELFKIVFIILIFIILEVLNKNTIKKRIIILIIWLLILFFGNYNNDTFIYFQF